jgi:HAE1 family hydrophobic/amphiphilic exporter-1
MLCSRFVKPAREHAHGRFYRWSEVVLGGLQREYERSLRWSLAHKRFIGSLFVASLVATVFLFHTLPQDFLPSDDIGLLTANTEGANGISFEEMRRHQDLAARILWNDPNVLGAMSSVGSGGARGGSNQGSFRITLEPREQRRAVDQVIAELRRKFAAIPGLNVYLQNRPILTIGGLVSKAQYQYTLQDADTAELYTWAGRLKDAISKLPGFLDVTSDLDLSTPSVHISVDRDRTAALGVSMQQIETALGASFGGQQISIIDSAADQFKVMLELLPRYQQDSDALQRLYLSGSNGSLVPLSAVTKFDNRSAPLAVAHFGQLPAVTISFSLPPGTALRRRADGNRAD